MRISRHGRSRGVAVASLAAFALVVTACSSTTTPAASSGTSAAGTTAGSAGSSDATTSKSSSPSSTSSSGGGTGNAKTAKSMADFGGMAGLEAAANKEGALNVIAVPPDWANYGEILAAFQGKYPGIKVDQQNPAGSSADEMAAAVTNKGTDVAPDVFDLGTSVALASVASFAPYQVAAWADIPDANKEATGLWVNDYTGTMVIGYDATQFGDLTSIDQLTDPKYKGIVALNGNPTQAGAAFNGVVMAALAKGGSLDNIAPGVDFFASVKAAGNLFSGDATKATVMSGDTAVLFDWSYNQVAYAAALKAEGVDWKLFVPKGAEVGSYYNQAINLDAPHPAAARLWEEFLYSADAQNMWLKGGANPVLQAAMVKAGTINKDYLAVLGTEAAPAIQTTAQITAAAAYLKDNWSKVSG